MSEPLDDEGSAPDAADSLDVSEREGPGSFGEELSGPPWILGHRGSPREAPENTLASLRRALDLGLDGVEYDLHACATGEAVLLHDDTLERTTNLSGPVSARSLPELSHADAGSWFAKRFAGEPLPLFEEALELPGARPGDAPRHMIELKDPRLVAEVARQLAELPRPLPVHIASFYRAVCLEARDAGLPQMLLAVEANEDDRRFVRDERLTAHGVGPGGWDTPAGALEWACERWTWSLDDPDELLAACRRPLAGLNTNHPLRALAVRALAQLTPHDTGAYPLSVPFLEVPDAEPGSARRGRHGEWSGRWQIAIGVRNPFPWRVEVALTCLVRGGAFEIEGLPATLELEPGARGALDVRLAGGSWSPSDDPLVLARFVWSRGPGWPRGDLILDAPLARVRRLSLGRDARRVPLLIERPGDPEASMVVRRRGAEVIAEIESAGGLEEARALLRLGAETYRGARGVRAALPESGRHDPRGVPFSVGLEGRDPKDPQGRTRLRRWAGGLPPGLFAGAPGRLLPAERA